MKRRAFTLMELLISVVLIALIAMYLYASLGRTRASTQTLKTHTEVQKQRLKVYELLYRDLVEAYSIAVQESGSKRYHLLKLQTGNSLYDIAAPYVLYYVRSDTLQLIRLESAVPITLPIRDDNERNRLHADLIEANVTDLNFYIQTTQNDTNATAADTATVTSAERNVSVPAGPRTFTNHLLYLATQKGDPLLVEIAF